MPDKSIREHVHVTSLFTAMGMFPEHIEERKPENERIRKTHIPAPKG